MLFHLSQREIAVTSRKCFLVLSHQPHNLGPCAPGLWGVEFFNNSAPSPRVTDLCLGSAQHPEPSSFLPLPTVAGSFCFCSAAKGKCIFAWASSLPAKFMAFASREGRGHVGGGFHYFVPPTGSLSGLLPSPSLAYRWRPMVKLRSAFLCV